MVFVVGAAFALVAARAVAGGGADLAFDGDGIATTDLGGRDIAIAVAVQPDGKILAAGWTETEGQPTSDFSVDRYQETGALDTGFGTGGKVRFAPRPGFGTSDMALQGDGKIVLVGVGSGGAGRGLDAVVARLNGDGSVDTGFGEGGSTAIDFAGSRDSAEAVVVQSDGKIVVAGDAADNARHDEDFALARLTADGKLDPSFGAGGRVRTDFPGGSAGVFDVTVQPDGKIVAVGRSGHSFNTLCSPGCSLALARYNADGTLDSSFGGGGLVTQGFALPEMGEFVALQSDGKIVVAGSTPRVLRFTAAGVLDAAFGNGGTVENLPLFPAAVLIDRAGRIVVGGSKVAGPASNFAAMRLLANGAPDLRYGTPSVVPGPGLSGSGADGALDAKGRLVVAGSAWPTGTDGPFDFAVARFLPPACVVPNVRSATLKVAGAKLLGAGCTTGRVKNVRANAKKGRVTAQSAKPGTQLPEGAPVALTVSKGPRK